MNKLLIKAFWIWFLLNASISFAQKYPEGMWQGYDGEWKDVSQQLIALAEATPAEKFAWRPAVGFARQAKYTCTLPWQISIC